jgi:hypothetical protein
MVGIFFMLGGAVLFVATIIVAVIFGVNDSYAKKEMKEYIDEQY